MCHPVYVKFSTTHSLTGDKLLRGDLSRRRGDLPHAEVGQSHHEVRREQLLELRVYRLLELLRLLEAWREWLLPMLLGDLRTDARAGCRPRATACST